MNCGYVGCKREAVAQTRQLIGKKQRLPVCQKHHDQLIEAWGRRPSVIAALPNFQVMEALDQQGAR